MSRLGYWCRSCGCFRENIQDARTRHILAAKETLCTEGEDPFGNGLCSEFASFEEVRKRKRYRAARRDHLNDVVNY
jgi:hypothetical protein